MKHASTALLLSLALGAHGQTDNCEGIRRQIEGRYQAGGVPNPVLTVVAAGSTKAGKPVGSCGNGSRQIVFTGAGPAAAEARGTAPAAAADKIPTECKDGSIVIGPRCDDPRAFRMTGAELAGSATPPAKPASQ